MSKTQTKNICKKCGYLNEKEALFCAECGEKIPDNSFLKRAIMSFLILISLTFITSEIYQVVQHNKIVQQQERKKLEQQERKKLEQQERIKFLNLPIKEVLTPIKKGTFESSSQFNARLNTALNERKVGTATLLNYDANKEVIEMNINYDKNFKTFLLNPESYRLGKKLDQYLAKDIFSKTNTVNIFVQVSHRGDKLKVIGIYTNKNKLLNFIDKVVYLPSLEVQDTDKIVKLDWYDAQKYCTSSWYKGVNNWRLPSIEELKLIYDNKEKFHYLASNNFWSSTLSPGTSNRSDYYFKVNFGSNNKQVSGSWTTKNNYVSCVRDRQ